MLKHADTPEPSLSDSPLMNPLHTMWNDSSDSGSGVFGLPFGLEDASLLILAIPWDAATSQGTGTAKAPELVLECSRYVELHDLPLGNTYERGIVMPATPDGVTKLVNQAQSISHEYPPSELPARLDPIAEKLNTLVLQETSRYLAMGKSVALLGGDHSVSYGSIAAHHNMYPDMGILQIDAHADLRPSLDGLTRSHASVMWHVMESLRPACLTQVGVRAICSVERAYQESNGAINVFTDHHMQLRVARGDNWFSICDDIIDTMPERVYLTLDIDGLDPAYCPNTGTPVPGGLSFTQLQLLLQRLIDSGRTLCGFDLVEVGGHPQDALIAAHLLYRLCGLLEDRSDAPRAKAHHSREKINHVYIK